MNRQHSPEVIAEALSHVPNADDDTTWTRMGMAVRSELGDAGFDIWDAWSQGAHNYSAKASKIRWRSFKQGGRVTIGSLFYTAQQHGFKFNGHGDPYTPADMERIRLEQHARQQQEEAEKAKRQDKTAQLAEQIYNAGKPAESHPYLVKKGITTAPGVRVGNWFQVGDDGKRYREKSNCLLIPLRDENGKLWNLQAIFPEIDAELERDRDYLSGGRKQGCYFAIGQPAGMVVIAEGFATAQSVRKATGHAVCVAFDKGNLVPVAAALRAKMPEAKLVLAADNDIKEGRPNYGLEAAWKAAVEVSALIAVPDMGGEKCDFNDLSLKRGVVAVKAAIEGARPPAPKEQEEHGEEEMRSNVLAISNNDTAEGEWRQKPLQRKLAAPTPFPVEALGDVLGGAARAMSEVIQAPLAICANSVLAAAALSAQGHANLLIDGRRHPLSAFFLTIGATGERKSAVDKVALHPHRERQQELQRIYAEERAEYDRAADAYKKSKEEAISSTKAKNYEAKVKALRELGDEPLPPITANLICEEPTYEGLVKMLEIGQPSVGLFSDEGGRMIGGHGMSADNMLKTAAGLSGLWDGREISRVRAGEGATLLYGRRVSLHLMCQPEIAQLMLGNAMLQEQGLVSRCLVTWPASTAGTRYYKEVDLSEHDAIKAYSAATLELLNTSLTLRDGTRNELSPRDLPLSQEAKGIWIAFHDAVEKQLVDGGDLSGVRGLANKAPEHAGRLAGILALVENAATGSVSARWMEAGIQLVTHYLNEAIRLQEAGAADPDLREAERLLTWCRSRAGKTVSLVEIYQLGPNSVRSAARARHLMKILEEHGQVKPTLDARGHKEAWRLP